MLSVVTVLSLRTCVFGHSAVALLVVFSTQDAWIMNILWLGRAYLKVGKQAKAKTAFQRASRLPVVTAEDKLNAKRVAAELAKC